jgi:P pilus assembly chaperone PapD
MKWISSLLFFLVFSLNSFAYLNIYPTSFYKPIDGKGATEEFTLSNMSTSPIKYKIYIEETEKNFSMVPWIEIYPKTITLKPGEEKKIKLYIKAPSSVKEGEYKAILGFKEIYIPTKEKNSTSTSLKLLTDLKLHITGYVGNLKPIISGKNIYLTAKGVTGSLINSGNRYGDIEIYLANKSYKNMYFLGATKIKKNESIELSTLKLSYPTEGKKYDRLRILEKSTSKVLGEFLF